MFFMWWSMHRMMLAVSGVLKPWLRGLKIWNQS